MSKKPPKEPRKNHINPQGLLRFWCKNGALKVFYKKSMQVEDSNTEHICFLKDHLPPEIEKEFARWPDAEITDQIREVIRHQNISEKNRFYISRFFNYQGVRNPFYVELQSRIIEKFYPQFLDPRFQSLILQRYFPIYSHRSDFSPKHLAVLISYLSSYTSAVQLMEPFMLKKWKLLDFGKPCLVTNEAIFTPSDTFYYPKFHQNKEIYFPISPQYCIVLSDVEYNHSADDDLIVDINNLISRYPYTNHIVFNEDYDPMPNIKLHKHGIEAYPQMILPFVETYWEKVDSIYIK